MRGAYRDRHDTRGGMRWTRRCRKTNDTRCGRRSRVVLAPLGWCQACDGAFRIARATVTKRSWTPGRARISRKPLAQGRPDRFRRTCGDLLVCFFHFAREAAGAIERPAFPAPSIFRGTLVCKPRAHFTPRECEAVSGIVIAERSDENARKAAETSGPDDVRSIRVILATGLRILRPNGLWRRSFGSTSLGRRISLAC
jgi:hypothetical protein